jgi:hypothetical protein
MRTFAYHDENGNVSALVTASGPKVAMITPKAGQFVTEIDSMGVDPLNMDIAEIRQIVKEIRIPVPRFPGSKGI